MSSVWRRKTGEHTVKSSCSTGAYGDGDTTADIVHAPKNALAVIQLAQTGIAVTLLFAAMFDMYGNPWGNMRKIYTWVIISSACFASHFVLPMLPLTAMINATRKQENGHTMAHYSPFRVNWALNSAFAAIEFGMVIAFWKRFEAVETAFNNRYEPGTDVLANPSAGLVYTIMSWNNILLVFGVHGILALFHMMRCWERHTLPLSVLNPSKEGGTATTMA